jgi:asparagine synthase (glutamine-hydrolysing)
MLGLTIACELDEHRPLSAGSGVRTALPDESRLLFDDEHLLVSSATRQAYPLAVFETPSGTLILEGRIYSARPESLSGQLTTLAEEIARERDSRSRLAHWLRETDGDFVLLFIERRRRRLLLLTDLFGRLPVYWTPGGSRIVISRSLRLAGQLAGRRSPDPMAIAQYLLLQYPVGGRTLLDGVRRIPPASAVSLDRATGSARLDVLHRFNFDVAANAETPIREDAEVLRTLVTEACRRRHGSVEGSHSVVSLSGGLDSRAIAGALRCAELPFRAATILDANGGSLHDARGAEQIAALLGVPWHLYRLPRATGAEALELLSIKDGMNPLGMSFIINFLRRLQADWGEGAGLFTGDGGDKVLPCLSPAWTPKTLEQVAHMLIADQHVWPLDRVAEISSVTIEAIVEELAAALRDYPETSLANKYVHFLVYERAHKYLFEGEDRNRAYLWPMSPFYAPPVFEYAMGCGQRKKRRYRLYRELLGRMLPQAGSVPNANWGFGVSTPGTGALLAGRELFLRLPRWLRVAVRRGGGAASCAGLRRCLLEQLNGHTRVRDQLRVDAARDGVATASREQAEVLLTVVSAVEWLGGGASTLERYRAIELE